MIGEKRMKTQIVVVDDEKDIADLVELYLQNEKQYEIIKFYDAKKAYHYLCENKVDLAILDVMMPGIDGMTICRKLRDQKKVFPILMLTAKNQEANKISGFACGADDYVTKPFLPMELIARVKAQLRRSQNYNHQASEEKIYSIRGLFLDVDHHLCTLNEKDLYLTPKEFAILALLCEYQGMVLSPDKIFETIWKDKYYSAATNTVMVHIRHIREKMNDNGEKPKYIKTIWGVGYKIEE